MIIYSQHAWFLKVKPALCRQLGLAVDAPQVLAGVYPGLKAITRCGNFERDFCVTLTDKANELMFLLKFDGQLVAPLAK